MSLPLDCSGSRDQLTVLHETPGIVSSWEILFHQLQRNGEIGSYMTLKGPGLGTERKKPQPTVCVYTEVHSVQKYRAGAQTCRAAGRGNSMSDNGKEWAQGCCLRTGEIPDSILA